MNLFEFNDHVRTYGGSYSVKERLADIKRLKAEIANAERPPGEDDLRKQVGREKRQVAQSNAVNEKMKGLCVKNRPEFEKLRKLPFEEQCKYFENDV